MYSSVYLGSTESTRSIHVGSPSGTLDCSGEPNFRSFRAADVDAKSALLSSVSINASSSSDLQVGLFLNIAPPSSSSSSDMCAGLNGAHLSFSSLHTCADRRSHTYYHMVQTQVMYLIVKTYSFAVIEWPFFSIQLHWECASVFAYRSRCLLRNGKKIK